MIKLEVSVHMQNFSQFGVLMIQWTDNLGLEQSREGVWDEIDNTRRTYINAQRPSLNFLSLIHVDKLRFKLIDQQKFSRQNNQRKN